MAGDQNAVGGFDDGEVVGGQREAHHLAAQDQPFRLVCVTAALLDQIGDELHELQTLAGATALEDLQRMVTLLLKLQIELVNSPYPLLSLEMALVRLANLPPSEDLAKLLVRLESLERRLASGPRVALRYMKRNFNAAEHATLKECLDLEAWHHIRTGETEDHKEAARAFVEKRTPTFKGR